MRKDLEEKTISVEKIFKGKVLDVEVHTVSLPDREVSKRELINHRGAVAVLALTKDNEVILVEQYRKAIEAVTLEIPAGKLEPGEDNKKLSAIRELQEETGAKEFMISPICVYSVTGKNRVNETGEETYGMLFFADIKEFDDELHSEIEKIVLFDELPSEWTYPSIQPLLIEEYQRRL